ncbi:MAG: domain S-box/diguanylate cyclase protein [Devosia sp.]|uniref:diguanylate cyclase n=1 Tax=Devosia sp. TaxID=1871048 RepID=UPI002609DCCE|nr:diguanylate cyclase [Devosia sp.]MDB5528656.1 domain S-box/diguanylate cyclase protein [Devosia sp.]
MHPVWYGLLANLAVVTIFVSSWAYIQTMFDRWSPWVRALALGVLFGIGAVMAMLSAFSLEEGVFFDLRTTLISSAGLFGGPVAGLSAALIAASYRIYMGGAGVWSASIGIAATLAVSLGLYAVISKRAMRRRDILTLALLLAAVGIAGMFTLPSEHREAALAHIAVPSAVLHFISSLLAGLALLYDERRRTAVRENQTYRTIIESLPDSLNVKDREGRFIAANPATAALMHAESAADLIGKTDADFYAPPVASRFRQDELEVMASGVMTKIDQKVPNLDGNPKWLSTLKVPLFDESGAPAGIITLNRDVTERRNLALALEQSQQQLSYAMAQMADGVAMFDKSGYMVFCNEQYRNSFPLTQDVRVPGNHVRDMLRASAERGEQTVLELDDLEAWIDQAEAALYTPTEHDVPLIDGRWVQVRTSSSPGGASMVVVSDISKIKTAETNLLALTNLLQQQAITDGLTGLLNRRAFDQGLESELARSQRDKSWISLLLMDIDRFKAFNDYYGHQEGDTCLRAVSAEFKRALKRPGDVAARYGGEEFVAILPDTDEDGAFAIADEFLKGLRALGMSHVGSEKGIVTASIGIACYRPDEHSRGAAELVGRADQALYDAKLAGRDRLTGWKQKRAMGAA